MKNEQLNIVSLLFYYTLFLIFSEVLYINIRIFVNFIQKDSLPAIKKLKKAVIIRKTI